MEFTKKGRRRASGTLNRDHTSPNNAVSTSLTESGEVSVTPIAKPPAACSPDTKGSLRDQPCQKSLVVSRVSTSSTPTTILVCPVTGKPIPSLEKIEKTIDQSLTLLNWRWPRSIAVKGIALALRSWAEEVGLEKAAIRGELLLGMPRPMEYADASNLPWLRLEDIPQLTPEEFADRLGGIVDDLERTAAPGADKRNDDGDQRLLPGSGGAPEGCGAGGEPRAERSDGGDGEERVGGSEERGRVLAFHPKRRSRDGSREGLSRRDIIVELREHQADLKAFQDAYGCIHRRVQSVKDESQIMKLVNWSGTSAVMGSLEMSIHALERVVEELKDILFRIDEGVIPNTDEE